MVIINGEKPSRVPSTTPPSHLFNLEGSEEESESSQFVRKQVRADYFDNQITFANGL